MTMVANTTYINGRNAYNCGFVQHGKSNKTNKKRIRLSLILVQRNQRTNVFKKNMGNVLPESFAKQSTETIELPIDAKAF
jgi:hypothetical protein